MSELKISNNLFLGKAELDRFKQFIQSDGYVANMLKSVESFGIIRNKFLDENNEWLKLTTSNVLGVANLNPGYAYDKNGNLIALKDKLYISIPEDGNWYWLRIGYAQTTIEKGTISIGGTNGALMTGTDTEFTKLFRGQPNFASKIRFVNSTNYTQEYEILEVVDDNNCLVQGVFNTLEEDLQFVVVGTFTPGYYPEDDEKEIFKYDSIEYSLIQEVENKSIAYTEDEQFLVARISNIDGVLDIQDKRHAFQFKTRAESQVNNITREENALIGIEYMKKFNFNDNKFYSVRFDWKFNIDGQNINTTTSSTTIYSGYGGKYKSIDNFSEGDFDGWRYYYENGEYSNVLSSIKNSDGTLSLVLDSIKEEYGIGVAVCPNADNIGIIFNFQNDKTIYSSDYKEFPINHMNPIVTFDENKLSVLNQFCDLKWYYKSGQVTSQIFEFNESTYYTEKAYDSNGVLVDSTQKITKQDLYFNGGVDPGFTDKWIQFYPSEYSLLYGNNERVKDASTISSKLFYKFYGKNTVKIQGRIKLTLTNDSTVNNGLAPNGILFNTPFTWFDDTVGNMFIRAFTGQIKYVDANSISKFENTRVELFYDPNSDEDGDDNPTNKIAVRYMKNGIGEIAETTTGSNVTYSNPFPTSSAIGLDVDIMVYFDEFDDKWKNGPIGVDNTNPNVASGGLPSLDNYSIDASVNDNSNGFYIDIKRTGDEINYDVNVNYKIVYQTKALNSSTTGILWWKKTTTWYTYYDNTITGSVDFSTSKTLKSISETVRETVYSVKSAKITGVTLK